VGADEGTQTSNRPITSTLRWAVSVGTSDRSNVQVGGMSARPPLGSMTTDPGPSGYVCERRVRAEHPGEGAASNKGGDP
jgi:hypothetical protein